MRVDGCVECERLWKNYTDATFAFVRIKRQANAVQLRQEHQEIIRLLMEGVGAAARSRRAAQERLKEHEATHKGPEAAS
jgi:hypothetical protein